MNNIYHYNSSGKLVPVDIVARDEDEQTNLLIEEGKRLFYEFMPFISLGYLAANTRRTGPVTGCYSTSDKTLYTYTQLIQIGFRSLMGIDLNSTDNGEGEPETVEVPRFESNAVSNSVLEPLVVEPKEDWYEFPIRDHLPGWSVYLIDDYTHHVAYIVAISRKEAKLLPIPNQFEGGKMCMGSHFSRPAGVQEGTQYVIDEIFKSIWNRDLFTSTKENRFNQIFRFHDGKALPIKVVNGDFDNDMTFDARTKSIGDALLIPFGPGPQLEALINHIQEVELT